MFYSATRGRMLRFGRSSLPTLIPRLMIISAIGLSLSSAHAQTEATYLKDAKEAVKTESKTASGWDRFVSLGANFSFASSNNVVGQLDGATLTVGAQIEGGVSYAGGGHEWRNILKISEATTRSPGLSQFVKSNDSLSLQSVYLYHPKAIPWLGPFARANLDTAIFQGKDIRATPVEYLTTLENGTTESLPNATGLRLSDPFLPMRLRETAGIFATAIDRTPARVEFRVGMAASQTLANGQFAVEDDDTTVDVIEVTELRNAIQGGPAAGIDVSGSVQGGKISYFAGAEAMLPLLNDDPEDRDAIDILNIVAEAGLSVKIFSWASLDYRLKMIREPQVLDQFQVQNNLMLTFSYALATPRGEIKGS